jgi:hypothetical protein
MNDRLWLEAEAGLQTDLDAQVREEAYEVFVAEAARSRLVDRVGRARLVLRCGAVVTGELEPMARVPAGVIALRDGARDLLLVPVYAVLLSSGSRPGLRSEQESRPTLTATLREAWSLATPVRVLLADGRWVSGTVGFVGADHLDMCGPDGPVSVPFASVEAWSLGDGR